MNDPNPEDLRVAQVLWNMAFEEDATADHHGAQAERLQYQIFDYMTKRDAARRKARDYRTAALKLRHPLQVMSDTVASTANGAGEPNDEW